MKIIQRDAPLTTGRKIFLRVETYYEISVDEYLDGEESITIDEIELDLGGKYRSSSQISLAARRGDLGDAQEGDAFFGVDVSSTEYGAYEARFETRYEEERRKAGFPSYGAEYVSLPPA